MMPQKTITTIAKLLGSIISVAGIAFVLYKLVDSWKALSGLQGFTTLTAWLLFLAIIYGLSQVLISRGWHLLLAAYDEKQLSFLLVHKINARTQIAKYLPSNILHHAGRLTMGKAYGLNHISLVKASMDEMLLMALSAALLSGICALYAPVVLADIAAKYLNAVILSFAAFILARLVLHVIASSREQKKPLAQITGKIAFSGIHYLVFISTTAIINTAMANQILGFANFSQSLIFSGTFLLAWLIGFVTPGAPGGIGVREAILIMALGSTFTEANIVLAALCSRIISIIGDIIFFGLSFPNFYKTRQES